MKKFSPLIILFVMAATIACHKFKEDSFISLRTPFGRLRGGTWTVVSWEKNNQAYSDTLTKGCNKLYFYNNGSDGHFLNSCGGDNHITISKSDICAENHNNSCILRTAYVSFQCMVIIKLYGKDLWLQANDNNDVFLIKLKKVKR